MAQFYSDAYAARPAAGTDGDLFIPTDGYHLFRDNGGAWTPWGLIFPMSAPPTTGWSWVNQSTATVDESRTVFHMNASTTGGSNQWRLRVRSAPSTPWTLTTYVENPHWNGMHAGLLVRDSSSGRFTILGRLTREYMTIRRYTAPATFSAAVFTNTVPYGQHPWWWRLVDDGVNHTYYYSADGQHFVQIYQEARATFTANPDQIGWGMNPYTVDQIMALWSWDES